MKISPAGVTEGSAGVPAAITVSRTVINCVRFVVFGAATSTTPTYSPVAKPTAVVPTLIVGTKTWEGSLAPLAGVTVSQVPPLSVRAVAVQFMIPAPALSTPTSWVTPTLPDTTVKLSAVCASKTTPLSAGTTVNVTGIVFDVAVEFGACITTLPV